jgi:hypothetical protein
MRARLCDFLHSLFARTGPGKNGRRIPTLEVLETRATPSVTWNNNPQDGHIDITAGETVSVGSTDNNKLRITADGSDLSNPPQQAASSIISLTITATNGFANNLDVSGINTSTEFTQLTAVVVNIDARDTVNHAGWTPAGSEIIDGRRYLDFTRGGATLKITDVSQARGIEATLVRKKVHGKVKLLVRVTFADTGELKEQFLSPLQRGRFKGIGVSVKDSNGDGVADTVVLTGRKNGTTITRELPG